MEPFDIHPTLIGAFSHAPLGRAPAPIGPPFSSEVFPDITDPFYRIDHEMWGRPATLIRPMYGTATAMQGESLPELALGMPESYAAKRIEVYGEKIAPSFGLRDLGPQKGLLYALILGLNVGQAIIINNQYYGMVDTAQQIRVPGGNLVVVNQDGTVFARGRIERGHSYEVQELALVKAMELFTFEGPLNKGPFQFELSRVSQSPGERITVSRLKRASYVHAGGIWVQADENGTAQIGPLEPGTYSILVTDQWGVQYSKFDSAVPGDTLYGGFNFSSGYGYYGWYSGKGVEIKRAFIEVVDELGFTDPGQLNTIRQITAFDTFSNLEIKRGTKGPAKQMELLKLDDPLTLNPIKNTVHDFFVAVDTVRKHLAPRGLDTVKVEDHFSYYNTRIVTYDFVNVRDRSNHPASWSVLDVFRTDDLPTATRTKQTVYDFFGVAEAGKTTYRHFVKSENVYITDQHTRKNLTKWGMDLFYVVDYKVQTLLTILGEDLIAVTDTAIKRLGNISVWDSMLVYDHINSLRNVHFTVYDLLEGIDRVVGHAPYRSKVTDLWQTMTTAILGVQRGQVPISNSPELLIKRWSQHSLDKVTLHEEWVPEVPLDSEVPQLVERTMLNRSYRRTETVSASERGILSRHITASDEMGLSERSFFPQAAQFSPDSLALTKLASFQYRPEVRLSKSMDGTMYAAYLREGGGLYLAKSSTDGSWSGVTAKLITNTPVIGTRSPAVAEHRGSLYLGYAVSGENATTFTVLKDGQPFWTRTAFTPGMDLQLVSTERYQGIYGELLIGYTQDKRTLNVYSAKQGTHSFTQQNDVRLDQVAVANGVVTWVLAVTDIPGKRNVCVSHGSTGYAVRDSRTVQARPVTIRREAVLVAANVLDTLSVTSQMRDVDVEYSDRDSGITETLSVQSIPIRVQLVKTYDEVRVQDFLASDWRIRQLSLPTSRLGRQPGDAMQLSPNIQTMRLTPLAVEGTSPDELNVELLLQGGHYERIK